MPMRADDRPNASPPFSPDEALRYSRHMVLPEFGEDGQQALRRARVLLVGAGGLGSPAALYLAAAGVGTLGLVDCDRVDASNLQRQILYGTSSLGQSKLSEAKRRIADINHHVTTILHDVLLTSANALDILRDYDVVIDGTDNFPTRYLVNDACALLKKPNVYGSIFRFDGQAAVFDASRGPCYRCLYAEPPDPGTVPSCAEGGVLGVLPGIIGVIQATEAIKLVTGIGEPLIGRLLLYDALGMRFHELNVRKNPDCPLCGAHPTIHALIDYDAFCGVPHITQPSSSEPMTVNELHDRRQSGKPVTLLDVREPFESQICSLGGTLIPIGQIAGRLGELDKNDEIVVYCHSGVRSANVVAFLRERGFAHARNLEGGVDAWARLIDPTMPRY